MFLSVPVSCALVGLSKDALQGPGLLTLSVNEDVSSKSVLCGNITGPRSLLNIVIGNRKINT